MKAKNLKRKISLVLTLAMFGVSACSGNAGSPSPSEPGSSAASGSGEATEPAGTAAKGEYNTDVTIQIFQSKVEITEQLEAMAKEYTALTGVKVEVLGATGDDFLSNLVAKLGSGQGPTIFNVPPGSTLEKLHTYLYDLSDQPYIADIAENQALMYDGKVLGVPYGVEGYGLIYNKDLVDPAKMTDFASFASYAQELKASGVAALQLSDKTSFLIGHIFNIPFALQPDFMDYLDKLNKGDVRMAETPEFQEWAKFMEVIRQTAENPMGVTYDDQIAGFATAQTAMIHQGNWTWGMFTDYDIDFDMSIAPLPVMGNDKLSVGMPNAWCINKDRDQAEIDEALKFFEWFFASERGHHYITEEFKFIPALKSIEVTSLDPLAQSVLEYSNSGKTLPWTYRYWPVGILDTRIFPVGQKFFADPGMTGQQLLEELDKAWSEGVAATPVS